MKGILSFILAVTPGVILASDQSAYAEEEHRSIKSLSVAEVKSLRSGEGMGFAKLAELNHFPGPKHVLELADDLELTPSQLVATEVLFAEMQLNAVALGGQLLEAEADLDRDFERGALSPESLESALFEIGKIRAQLRYVHLEAHLRQKALLTSEQVAKYDAARGYLGEARDHNGRPHDHR